MTVRPSTRPLFRPNEQPPIPDGFRVEWTEVTSQHLASYVLFTSKRNARQYARRHSGTEYGDSPPISRYVIERCYGKDVSRVRYWAGRRCKEVG